MYQFFLTCSLWWFKT